MNMIGNKAGIVERIFIFKMPVLENTLLDSAIELVVTSDSDYN